MTVEPRPTTKADAEKWWAQLTEKERAEERRLMAEFNRTTLGSAAARGGPEGRSPVPNHGMGQEGTADSISEGKKR